MNLLFQLEHPIFDVILWQKKDIFDIDESVNKFDGVCMSYGLRNLNDVENGIKKVFSILKKNGRAGFLDFNHAPDNSYARIFQKIYLRYIVVPISFFFNLKDEYSYIENSISRFPTGDELQLIAVKIGFKKVKYLTIFGGQMGLLILEK